MKALKTLIAAVALFTTTQAQAAKLTPMERVQAAIPAGTWVGTKHISGRATPCTVVVRHRGSEMIGFTMEYKDFRGKPQTTTYTYDVKDKSLELDLDFADSFDLSVVVDARTIYPEEGEPWVVTATHRATIFFTPEVAAVTLTYFAYDGISDPHESQITCDRLARR